MKEWFTIAELAAAQLPDMPKSESGYRRILSENWKKETRLIRKVKAATRFLSEIHISLLPPLAQAKLKALNSEIPAIDNQKSRKKEIWARYESLSKSQKDTCESRLKLIHYAQSLVDGGLTINDANIVAAQSGNITARTLYIWQKQIAGFDRCDWLAALAPLFKSESKRADCHEQAWDVLCSDYLRASRPSFSTCYRRMLKAAKDNQWAPIPSERALRRRLDVEVPKAVQELARNGKDKAKTLFPAQRRDRSMLHAMQAVNMDGHKLDVFIKAPWSDKPVRLYLIGIQDLYSGKILSWRLSDAETWEIVRLVIGDMVEAHGIPEKITLDNGRAFASKWITGGTSNRFRFKIRDEDPKGLLTTLGIETQWTQPYSGQSKPIERAWRDLAEAIAKHPFCAGAYTGNKPDAKPEDYGKRAIIFDDFKNHVGQQIEDFNAQEGRKAQNCKGRSYNATFNASIEEPSTIIRYATSAQRALWLLASDVIRTRKGSGEIHFQGNRYWNSALNQIAGQKVTIRFDPDNLHQPIRVYDLNNVLICEADCIADTGFYDQDAARRHAQARKAYINAITAQKQATAKLNPDHLADVYQRIERGEKTTAPKAKVTRLTPLRTNGNLAVQQNEFSEANFEENIAKAMQKIASPDVIPFPKKVG